MCPCSRGGGVLPLVVLVPPAHSGRAARGLRRPAGTDRLFASRAFLESGAASNAQATMQKACFRSQVQPLLGRCRHRRFLAHMVGSLAEQQATRIRCQSQVPAQPPSQQNEQPGEWQPATAEPLPQDRQPKAELRKAMVLRANFQMFEAPAALQMLQTRSRQLPASRRLHPTNLRMKRCWGRQTLNRWRLTFHELVPPRLP